MCIVHVLEWRRKETKTCTTRTLTRNSVIVGVVARPDDFNQVDEDETNVGEEEEVSVYTPRSCKMRSVRLYLIWGEMQT